MTKVFTASRRAQSLFHYLLDFFNLGRTAGLPFFLLFLWISGSQLTLHTNLFPAYELSRIPIQVYVLAIVTYLAAGLSLVGWLNECVKIARSMGNTFSFNWDSRVAILHVCLPFYSTLYTAQVYARLWNHSRPNISDNNPDKMNWRIQACVVCRLLQLILTLALPLTFVHLKSGQFVYFNAMMFVGGAIISLEFLYGIFTNSVVEWITAMQKQRLQEGYQQSCTCPSCGEVPPRQPDGRCPLCGATLPQANSSVSTLPLSQAS